MRFFFLCFFAILFNVIFAASNKAYVLNFSDASVTVIDTISDTVIATVPVGLEPIYPAVLPNGGEVYIANHGSDNVSTINAETDTVVATIPVGLTPVFITATPDSAKVYVANIDTADVSVIRTQDHMVVATISTGPGSSPAYIAITPDGRKAYVANATTDTVSVIDVLSDTIIKTIPVGIDPERVVVTPDGKKVYVANNGSNSISVIDVASDAVIAGIGGVIGPIFDLQFTPNGAKLYVINNIDTVSVITTNTDTIATNIVLPTGSFPVSLAITADGTKVYTANTTGSNSSVISTATDTVIATVAPIFMPQFIGIVPGQLKAYITKLNSELAVINTQTETISTTLLVGAGDIRIGFLPAPERPENLSGRQEKHEFFTQTDLVNIIRWEAPVNQAFITGYKIYRNEGLTDLAKSISASETLQFDDHNRKQNQIYDYYVVSVNQNGTSSLPVHVTVFPVKP